MSVRLGYLWAFVFVMLCSACATTSAHAPRRTSMIDVGAAVGFEQLVYAHEAGSPFVVVIIPEFHHLPACQAQVYETLEALEPTTSFVAVEGRIGEVRHDELLGGYFLTTGQSSTYAGLAARPLSERRLIARSWASGRDLPREAGFDLPLHPAILYEAVYQDRVRSQGLEKPEVFSRAHKIADLYRHGGAAIPTATIIGARNRVFVRKLRHYGTYLADQDRDVVPFPVGAAHANDLARRLRRNRISYAIVVPPTCLGTGS